ncbi:2TM domain-containing protein [Flavobacterium salilacus subsp. salilacus]|uniref:2TM domain-containing protein n=1 Tax=Flavobacterium TaxID=237 RepID=UPI0010750342|nr:MULTISPECIES: 2TM domain-containing protein [Flavobacterium]KAF2516845.1 2TM domain-containing protein [Flavobacterium salilacus subsp. salilacus]MBE1615796.1 2TM domain-containing protein [Flavobacterium sp. SaA2.13]
MEKKHNEGAYQRAQKKVKEIKGFYINLACYCIVIPVLIYINLRFTPEYHWFWYSTIAWGSGVLIHGLAAFGHLPYMSQNWEERKIREFMEEERNKKQGRNEKES